MWAIIDPLMNLRKGPGFPGLLNKNMRDFFGARKNFCCEDNNADTGFGSIGEEGSKHHRTKQYSH
jgi:hypothetical protein